MNRKLIDYYNFFIHHTDSSWYLKEGDAITYMYVKLTGKNAYILYNVDKYRITKIYNDDDSPDFLRSYFIGFSLPDKKKIEKYDTPKVFHSLIKSSHYSLKLFVIHPDNSYVYFPFSNYSCFADYMMEEIFDV